MEVTFSAQKRSLMGPNEVTLKNLVHIANIGWIIETGPVINQQIEHRHFLLLILSNPKIPYVYIVGKPQNTWLTVPKLKRSKRSLRYHYLGQPASIYIYFYLEQPRLANQFGFHGRVCLFHSQWNDSKVDQSTDEHCETKMLKDIFCNLLPRVIEQLESERWNINLYVKKLASPILENVSSKFLWEASPSETE